MEEYSISNVQYSSFERAQKNCTPPKMAGVEPGTRNGDEPIVAGHGGPGGLEEAGVNAPGLQKRIDFCRWRDPLRVVRICYTRVSSFYKHWIKVLLRMIKGFFRVQFPI